MGAPMECSYCKKPCRGEIAFEILENVKGEGPVKRRACFPCISELGEKIMRPPRAPVDNEGEAPCRVCQHSRKVHHRHDDGGGHVDAWCDGDADCSCTTFTE